MNRLALLLFAAPLSLPLAASADEGMWLYNDYPKQLLKQRHGFAPSDDWLAHLRLSSVRLAGGCSGSFVSPAGLVMTNHHCAIGCLKGLSTAQRDLVEGGFTARTAAEERRCPEVEINQLVGIDDVTERVTGATKGLTGKAENDARKAEMSRIEKACATSDRLRCDVVSLYHGGRYHLYRYKRYEDVRLVFAPEAQMANFGGDPDNFNFPRFDLDASFLRVYEDGKPLVAEHYLKWSPAGPKEGELVFESGHPGTTRRLLSLAELEFRRDVLLPSLLESRSELRGQLTVFGRQGPEQRRQSREVLWGLENSLKVFRGDLQALRSKALWARKAKDEAALRARIDGDPALKGRFGGAFAEMERAQEQKRRLFLRHGYIEGGRAFSGDLFDHARTLLRAAAERQKPSEVRFREFRDSALPSVRQEVLTVAPIHRQLEILLLSFSLGKLREELGPDDEFVRKVLGKESPEDLAKALVGGTRLFDVAYRRQLWEGGQAAVEASTDPLIKLARAVDGDARALRRRYEDEVEAREKRSGELIGQARFAIQGTSSYPDATFTLRLAHGVVKGWDEGGRPVPAMTTIGGAFERHTGKEPFALPKSWLQAKGQLDLALPLNFSATTDSTGGNSGSPMINQKGEVVGLTFDGNIHSLGGTYWFDESLNRSVSVHSAALLEALRKVYRAERLVKELQP